MVANVKTAPVPPVPQYKNVLDAQGRFVSLEWLQWFVSVRDKINVINDLLVNLGLFTGGVPNIGPGGTVSAATTDDVPEGAVNKYFTEARVLETLLDGLTISPNSAIVDTDNIIEAFGKIQAQINAFSGSATFGYVTSVSVTGSAASSLAVSGLDLDTDKMYLVKGIFKNATGSASDIALYYNSDTTATNYYREGFTANNATLTGSRANNGLCCVLTASQSSNFLTWIFKDFDGIPRAFSFTIRGTPSGVILQFFMHGWTASTSVTGTTFSASVANSLSVGSTVHIYKILET